MDINQLTSFVSVVKNLSFTKAASELFISQPTVSSHIKNLEQDLNKQLIIRSTKSLIVTEYGWELYDTARQILNIQSALIDRWSDGSKLINKIGSSTIPSAYILPDVLNAYSKQYSALPFIIYQDDSKSIIENLKHGDYDIALTGMSANDPKIISSAFYTDEMILIAANNEKYSKYIDTKNAVESILKNEAIIFREEGSASQKKTIEIIEDIGIDISKLNVIARVNEPETIKNFVLKGFAVAIISKIAVSSLIDDGKLLYFSLPENVSKRNLYLLHNSSMVQNRELKKFMDFLVNYYRK